MSKTTSPQEQLPRHVAIICDGNRRWARTHGLKVFLGHRKALEEVVEPLVDFAASKGIEFLTFWVFSTENWQRPLEEVEYLMQLFREFFDVQIKRLHEKNVRVTTIGEMSKFAPDIQERIKNGKKLTAKNSGITVVLAMNYGGRDELVRAVNKLLLEKKGLRKKITEADIIQALDTADIPDPEFIIRPGGDIRLSGFLPWQSVYSEFAFPQFQFPDFSPQKFAELLKEFAGRKRRFGK